MTARHVLTYIWLCSFFLSIGVVEIYIHRTTIHQGFPIPILIEDSRIEALKPIVAIYSVHISAILGFWFTKPFKPAVTDSADAVRFKLAVLCAVVFNVFVLYLIGKGHISPTDRVMENIHDASKIATLMTFLVAPINAFYFGQKKKVN